MLVTKNHAWIITMRSKDNRYSDHMLATDDRIDTPEKLLITILDQIAREF